MSSICFFLLSYPLPLFLGQVFFLFPDMHLIWSLGARFGFTLDGELKKAASDDAVKAAIADKISRERVGHEVCSVIAACCIKWLD